MRTTSLSFRLIFSSALWSLLVLGAAGILLSSNYKASIEKNFDERLQIHLKALIAEVEVDDNKTLKVVKAPGDTRFEVPYSGWYWQIVGADRKLAASSKSLFDAKLEVPQAQGAAKDLLKYRYMPGPEGQTLRVNARQITLPGFEVPHLFIVAGNAADIEADVSSFAKILTLGLLVMALGVLVALFIQIRFGLRPLKQMQEALGEIRSGKKKELQGAYPSEITPLVTELNSLLKANREVVERARTHVGNLAHSLKTPLSVLSNEVDLLSDEDKKGKMGVQVEKMRNQISHHLERAQMAARTKTFGLSTPVTPVIENIVRALKQINKERALIVGLEIPEDIVFAGEKQDLEEIVGNILENGFKWARSEINIEILPFKKKQPVDQTHFFCLRVTDDGPGLSGEDIKEALKRGKRLDETKPGSGLGLSIVTELVDIYEGEISLRSPENAGLEVEITLPGVR